MASPDLNYYFVPVFFLTFGKYSLHVLIDSNMIFSHLLHRLRLLLRLRDGRRHALPLLPRRLRAERWKRREALLHVFQFEENSQREKPSKI